LWLRQKEIFLFSSFVITAVKFMDMIYLQGKIYFRETSAVKSMNILSEAGEFLVMLYGFGVCF